MAETKPVHTPTPWEYQKTTLGHPDNARNPIISAPTGYIARLFSQESTLAGLTSLAPTAETAAANAEFIVRACNAHDDLVAALEDVVEWGDYADLELVRASLAKATA